MKTALNIILIILVLVIWSDIEKNIENPELHYSDTICALAVLLFFGFFRVNYKHLIQYLKNRS